MTDTADASDPTAVISGSTASGIADSIRALIEQGSLPPGAALPPVRSLAERLGVNRNTATAAYGQLQASGLVVASGRGGTRVAADSEVAREGFAAPTAGLIDVGHGNPDPSLIPSVDRLIGAVAGRPVLYGAPVVDPELEAWAADSMLADLRPDGAQISVTNGASDALERLLTGSLTRGDAVAIEEPGFLSGIHTVRVGGFEAIGVPVDSEGITPDGVTAAIARGARAIICTPRAQNPTGVSITPRRADELRAVLTDHPYVLIIEDDHFSRLSRRPFHSIVPTEHQRFALVRSVSKFLGPDLSVALVASDRHTAERLGVRLRSGTAWVSHLLQRLALALLTDETAQHDIDHAADHYAARNDRFRRALADRGVIVPTGDGLNVWVPTNAPAAAVTARLRARGWIVRSGDEFSVTPDAPAAHFLRVTAHDLDDASLSALASAIADADSP